MQASLELKPIAGTESAELPGTREWKRERDWAIGGIPIPQIHLDLLTNIANELGIPLPKGNL